MKKALENPSQPSVRKSGTVSIRGCVQDELKVRSSIWSCVLAVAVAYFVREYGNLTLRSLKSAIERCTVCGHFAPVTDHVAKRITKCTAGS